jgi:hypothetical protein
MVRPPLSLAFPITASAENLLWSFYCLNLAPMQHLKNSDEVAGKPIFESPESGIETLTTSFATY